MFDTLIKKVLLTSILVLLCSISLFATVSYSPSAQGYVHGSFTFPTAEYLSEAQGNKLPAMRTSLDIGADVMAANFKFGKSEVGAGFSCLYNSRSLAAGNNILRSYSGIGFSIGYQYHFDGLFSLGGKVRYLFCQYRPLKNRFDIIEIEAVPAFDFVENERFETSLTVPVTASVKTDSVSVRVGVGFDIQYNLIFGAKHEKN